MNKTAFFLLFCFGISFSALAQQIEFKASDNRTSKAISGSKQPYPIHVSHILNSPEKLQELRELNKNMERTNRAKLTVDNVGDERAFFVANLETNEFESKNFRLMRKGNATQIWFEIAEINNGHLNDAVADSMFKYLEDISPQHSFNPDMGIIELLNTYMGTPPDYDGDGLVDFLITDIKDGYTPGGNSGYTGGFFYGVDQFPDANPDLYRSNERDVLYIDSYPGIYSDGEISALRPLSTLAHEYQHLIHYNYNGRLGHDELTFINEGQSGFAQLLSGYQPYDNNLALYLNNTNVDLFRWSGTGNENVYADYSRAAAFTSYMWDNLGFEHSGHLTQSPLSGVSGVEDALQKAGSSLTFHDLLVNWSIANLVNDKVRSQTDAYGYSHQFLKNIKASTIFENPAISNRAENVKPGAVKYLAFQQARDISVSLQFQAGGKARLILDDGNTMHIQTLESGETVSTEADKVYNAAYIVLINTNVNTAINFIINSSGKQAFDLAGFQTHSNASTFYSNLPYYNAGGVGRLGFSNKYVAEENGFLHSAELYIVAGQDASSGNPIEVKGNGLLRVAAYTDDNGIPGDEIAADSISFDELTSQWQNFDVSHWALELETGNEFHIVYEFVVPEVNPDLNAIPIRLDDGRGKQNVTFLLTAPNTWTPIFSHEENGTVIGQHGIWNRINIAIPTSNERQAAGLPRAYELYQNFPNPFNPTTRIYFALPEAQRVELHIYNSIGRKVVTLADGYFSEGTHYVIWNASGFASGVYFYRLKAENFTITRKMILMK